MTRKMMGVIYRAFKMGKLANTTSEDISTAYECVDIANSSTRTYDFYMFHHDAYEAVKGLEKAVEEIFKGNYEKADAITSGFSTVEFL